MQGCQEIQAIRCMQDLPVGLDGLMGTSPRTLLRRQPRIEPVHIPPHCHKHLQSRYRSLGFLGGRLNEVARAAAAAPPSAACMWVKGRTRPSRPYERLSRETRNSRRGPRWGQGDYLVDWRNGGCVSPRSPACIFRRTAAAQHSRKVCRRGVCISTKHTPRASWAARVGSVISKLPEVELPTHLVPRVYDTYRGRIPESILVQCFVQYSFAPLGLGLYM